jgi:hypothetical protein
MDMQHTSPRRRIVSANISVKINVYEGLIEVVSPQEHFREVFADAKEMLEIAKARLPPSAPSSERNSRDSKPDIESGGSAVPNEPRKKAAQSQRGRVRQLGGSSGRVGRIGSFEPVDLGLSEEQERRLMQFYEEKAPKEQTHQIAVAMYQGERELSRKSLSYNEIYTLLRLSGEKDLPKALDVVINRMCKENWAIRDAEGISLKFIARDFVEKSLPSG